MRICNPEVSLRPSLVLVTAWSLASLLLGLNGVLAAGTQRFENGLWYNGSGFERKTMFAANGVFVEATETVDTELIDLNGLYVVPPFGDAHDHALASPRFDSENERFLAQGIFYVGNPNSLLRWTQEARAKAARIETVDVRYSNGGLTSSGGHPMQIYDGLAEHSEEWSREELDGQAYFTIDDVAGLEKRWPEIL